MTPYNLNPFAHLFSALALTAIFLYVAFYAVDRWRLLKQTTTATIIGKQFSPGTTRYYTTMIDGRTIPQSEPIPERYVLSLQVGSEFTSGFVSKALYESVQVQDTVQVTVKRTRITKMLFAVDVRQMTQARSS